MDPFLLFVAFQEQPALALLPAALFGLLAFAVRRKVIVWTAALWLAYAGYEAGVKARLLCSGECNIRVDLLIIGPALLVLSVWSLVVALRALIRRARAKPESGGSGTG